MRRSAVSWLRAAGRRGQRGVAMVEFGLVLLPFFMLTVGIIDFGRAFYQYNLISGAAREGARFASVWCGSQHNNPPPWSVDGNIARTYPVDLAHPISSYITGTIPTIVGTVARYSVGFDLNAMTVNIDSNGEPRKPVTVTVRYAFQPATSLFIGGRTITLTASSRMILE